MAGFTPLTEQNKIKNKGFAGQLSVSLLNDFFYSVEPPKNPHNILVLHSIPSRAQMCKLNAQYLTAQQCSCINNMINLLLISSATEQSVPTDDSF